MNHRLSSTILTGLVLFALAPAARSQEPPPREAPVVPRARLMLQQAQRVAQIAPIPWPDSNRSTQVFQVTLLLASVSGESSPELPKAARQAVEGLKDFLPYKSYKVLDFAWVRTSGISQTQVKGPDGRAFNVMIRYDDPEENEGKIFIRNFSLEDVGDVTSYASDPTILLRSSNPLISTSFGMEIGETVVVGTSRLNGDGKALVVLLTAIPASVGGS
ncbi:MAG: hypothetical protein V3T72_07210 [Thermoanaerobaculia bacterium]